LPNVTTNTRRISIPVKVVVAIVVVAVVVVGAVLIKRSVTGSGLPYFASVNAKAVASQAVANGNNEGHLAQAADLRAAVGNLPVHVARFVLAHGDLTTANIDVHRRGVVVCVVVSFAVGSSPETTSVKGRC
jgi:tRNA A-37 threonylcarbamoyl transferase component Bud32